PHHTARTGPVRPQREAGRLLPRRVLEEGERRGRLRPLRDPPGRSPDGPDRPGAAAVEGLVRPSSHGRPGRRVPAVPQRIFLRAVNVPSILWLARAGRSRADSHSPPALIPPGCTDV